jgi:hypothetical protein
VGEEHTDYVVALMVEEGRVGAVVTVQFPCCVLWLILLAQVVQCMLPSVNLLVLKLCSIERNTGTKVCIISLHSPVKNL